MEKPHLLIIRESFARSIISDAVTLSLGVGIMLPGYFLNSAGMQWLGAIVFFWIVLAYAGAKRRTFSIDEARAELDRIAADMTAKGLGK